MNVWYAIVVLVLDAVIYSAVMCGVTRFGYDKYHWRNNINRETKICHWLLLGFVLMFLMMVVYFIPPFGRVEHLIYKIGAPITPAIILLFCVGLFAFLSAGESMGAITGILYFITIVIAPIVLWIVLGIESLMMINIKVPY